MYLLPLTLVLSFASAQTSPKTGLSTVSTPTLAVAPGTPSCAGAPVLEACLSSTTTIANSCNPADYNCLCEKWQAVAQCYNSAGCSGDPRLAGASSNQYAYCNNAALYSSKPPTLVSAAVASSTDSTGSTATSYSGSGYISGSVSHASGSGSGSGSGSSGSGTKTTGGSGSSAGSKTSSGSSSASSETGTGNAAASNLMVSAGGMVVALAGFVGVML